MSTVLQIQENTTVFWEGRETLPDPSPILSRTKVLLLGVKGPQILPLLGHWWKVPAAQQGYKEEHPTAEEAAVSLGPLDAHSVNWDIVSKTAA